MAELPSGTVTFLFSDIEGSTRLVKELRDRYGELHAEHQRLLRDAFASAGGQEIDTQGYSFFVAFRRARDAVAAKHPQVGFAGWFGLLLPSDVFATLRCGSADNWADFCDRGLDAQVRRLAAEEGSPTGEPELAAKLDRTFIDRSPWVPLWTPRLADFVSRRVGNYQYNAYDGTLLDQLWVK